MEQLLTKKKRRVLGGFRKSPGTVRSVPTLERSLLGGFEKILGQYEVPNNRAKSPRRVQRSPGTAQSIQTLERRVLGWLTNVLRQHEASQHLSEGS